MNENDLLDLDTIESHARLLTDLREQFKHVSSAPYTSRGILVQAIGIPVDAHCLALVAEVRRLRASGNSPASAPGPTREGEGE